MAFVRTITPSAPRPCGCCCTYKNVLVRGFHSSPDFGKLASRIPKGTWDTHMHVVEPKSFPLDKAAQYQPSAHTLDQAKDFLSRLGIERMVIVQPSIYGNDNACTLDGLKQLGPQRGRAVIQFDPTTTSQAQLREWHDMGVRGVRLNFKSVGGTPDEKQLASIMHAYADAVRDLGWVLELYIGLESIPLLQPVVKDLKGVKICIDHFGHPTAESIANAQSAYDIPGFSSLIALLQQGQTWVKLSASYRLHQDPSNKVVESLCRETLRARPDRCVFATDWPHTRFDNVEVGTYLEKILDWCEDEGVKLEQFLVTNAEELFDGGI